MSLFQAVFVPLCGAVASWFLTLMLRGRLSRRQGLVWLFVWGLAAALIAVPNTASSLAGLLGIGRGSDLVFYLAILTGLFVTVHFYNRYRRLEETVTELARQHALERAVRGPLPAHGGALEERPVATSGH